MCVCVYVCVCVRVRERGRERERERRERERERKGYIHTQQTHYRWSTERAKSKLAYGKALKKKSSSFIDELN